mgnify:CR=1 FL=1
MDGWCVVYIRIYFDLGREKALIFNRLKMAW